MQVKFREEMCDINFGRYGNGRIAMILTVGFQQERMATASVNLVDEPMEADEMAIKDYSENEGMLQVLLDAGIVSEPIRKVKSGYVEIPICKLLKGPEAK